MGGILLIGAGVVCVLFLHCAKARARSEHEAEMAQVDRERAEIDAAAEEGRPARRPSSGRGGDASKPPAVRPELLARLPTFAYADPPARPPSPAATPVAGAGSTHVERHPSAGGGSAPVERRPSSRKCIVCLAPLAEEKCVTLPCGHIHHAECVFPWLAEHGTCPECRLDVADALDDRPRRKGVRGG